VRASLAALEEALRARHPGNDRPLQGRMVMLVGVNVAARAIAQGVKGRGGVPIIASHERDAARELAQALECRFVQFEALYTTMHDVLVVCDAEADPKGRSGEAGVHPGYLKPGMTVMDLTSPARPSPLLREAEVRGCGVVQPRQLLLDRLAVQARTLTGKDLPREVLAEAMPEEQEEKVEA
jgi:shikimate 5-dehydrogenase